MIPEYADDEKNTLSQTVLMMMVGGGGVAGYPRIPLRTWRIHTLRVHGFKTPDYSLG